MGLALLLPPLNGMTAEELPPLGKGFYFPVGDAQGYLTNSPRRMRYDSSALRLGLVLRTAADASEPWTSLEFRRIRWPSNRTEITPFLRWSCQRNMVEIGLTPHRQLLVGWYFNF